MVQTLLFFSYYRYPIEEATNKSIIADQLEKTQGKYNIVLLCQTFQYSLCKQSESWLPRPNLIYTNFDNEFFNPHMHTILLDLVNNPKYDWRDR